LAALKEEGSRAFAMKKYVEANAAWDKALAMKDISSADAALLRNNKAACHMVSKKYKDAVAECSAALQAQPDYLKALVRRAKAYEAMGQYKQSLADLQAANKLDTATDDTRAAEQRVKDLAAGKGTNGGAVARKTPALGGAAGMGGGGRQVVVPVKITCGDDTRMFQVQPGVSYSEMMEYAKALFPSAGPFALKFLDKEGDLVTIASKNDINRAIQEAVESVDRKRLAQGAGLPPIRVQVSKVASEADVPKAPEEDNLKMQQMLQQLQRMQQLQGNKGAAAQQQQQQAQQQAMQQQVVIDEWILAFVDLLKEHVGVDPDRPVELQEIGQEKLNTAFQAMMTNDPKAEELLDQAEEKFKEVVGMGMICQSQVWEGKAQLLMQKAVLEGAPISSIAAAAETQLKKAEAKVLEALAYCPTLTDGYLMRNNIEQSRAKLAVGYVVPPVNPREDLTDLAERQAAEETASKEAVSKAFERVTKDGIKHADAFMAKAYAFIQEGIEALPEKEKTKELKPLKPMAEQVPTDPEDATPLKATLLITLGNAHYEHSILRAACGTDWKAMVEKAQALFRDAGAAESDIRQALKGHPKAEEMEDIIGPDPEPVTAPAPPPTPDTAAPVAAAAAADAPKGLPSLGQRKKKDAAAA
jgi:tetratricopeptide (TPR) repeat protein